jgi:GMP synthase (glutamine-hydrolysing)
MRILTVTHGRLVQPELFGDVAVEEGHRLVPWEIDRQGAPPRERYDAVMVFGGEQNVGEELEHPWLSEEYDALRRWVAEGTPLFAVCLGAQTLAHAVGARVTPLDAQLAGFYETELTDAGAEDPVFGVLPRRFDALNGNGYTFDVPAGAVQLARGPVPQAFRVGERAWAVQFHPEVRRDQVLAWFAADARRLPRPIAQIERELNEKLPHWQELGRRLCRAFLGAASV